ncbi:hypothetical protein [Paraferrimonas sp. SM1919]|uniref:hypothetical protein n=1 Tax=Paraferrimonas sp. SM1919 TaxID=2662263 RepID=UPI0013D1E11D|nr:hypothetical protein [Paraferrimonas sp. SM1919]
MLNEEVKLSILVVLYNCEISDSSTISSLINSFETLESLKGIVQCTIWNNGPVKISTEKLKIEGVDFTCVQTLNNNSLAKIYNKFILDNVSQNYLILDHDTTFEADFLLNAVNLKGREVMTPIVKFNDRVVYPLWNKSVVEEEGSYLSNLGFFKSIGSGLCFSKDIVNEYISKFGEVFDSRFYLYGVDTTFFMRLKTIDKVKIVVKGEICHSLSKYENETTSLTNFRIKERSYNYGLTSRYYGSLLFNSVKIFLIPFQKLFFKRYKEVNFVMVLKAFLRGEHYRE